MNDMRAVIIPKSDQINADSLLGGPMTITIAEVKIRPGTEQPVSIHFEGDEGKPYKPCKSMSKVMVTCWGPDAAQYAGRSMTIYCDPKVTWGGMAVGGIRISHMSHIDGSQTMALTATKGNKKLFTVKPLAVEVKVPAPTKAAATITDWIAAKLVPALAGCENADALTKVLQNKAYLSAVERGTEDERAAMKRHVDDAQARVSAAQPIDDEFPGDLPSNESSALDWLITGIDSVPTAAALEQFLNSQDARDKVRGLSAEDGRQVEIATQAARHAFGGVAA